MNSSRRVLVENCANCGISRVDTPCMRRGPDGLNSLCNSCGLVWRNQGFMRDPNLKCGKGSKHKCPKPHIRIPLRESQESLAVTHPCNNTWDMDFYSEFTTDAYLGNQALAYKGTPLPPSKTLHLPGSSILASSKIVRRKEDIQIERLESADFQELIQELINMPNKVDKMNYYMTEK